MVFALNEKAPMFTLADVNGEEFKLEEKIGKGWQLLVFFRGSWCPVCKEELQAWEEHRSFFENNNVNITAISTDNPEDLRTMTEEYRLTFPVLVDEALKVLDDYGVFYHSSEAPYEDHGAHGEPAYFLIDEEGRFLYQHRQTNPFGRPGPKELRKTVKYIEDNLK
ncbi:peroxiredoxin family protein [Marinococcus luteus]|uniref:peroxiredoxin family protein n=1 Tax=Marinococcus luteus TaxID=1122204 RepID=UPI002ACC8F5B|nr:redoxin domain-containing protein [Marinococcus luteus]MDZ5782756.1 redoxin domain-containing protein [Marinococcus luteus]